MFVCRLILCNFLHVDTDGGQSSMSMDIPTLKHHGRPPVDTVRVFLLSSFSVYSYTPCISIYSVMTFHLVLQRDQKSVSIFERLGVSNTLLTSLSFVTGSQSPNGVSSAVGLEGESTDRVPQDDSVECSGQFESRGSVTGSEEQTISESILQCV